MGFGSSSSNVAFSFDFIEGWYADDEVDVVDDGESLGADVGTDVGSEVGLEVGSELGGGSSLSNVVLLLDG